MIVAQILRDLLSAALLVFFIGGPFYLNIQYGFSLWWVLFGLFIAGSIKWKNDFDNPKPKDE